ncbi:lipoprotein [Pseudomonas sp. M47T1]|uniref:PA0061/PA0062 family lipoprotein n=1 Tax=Pseudomonas sp. M47T1 TaxID=1179778 RepID=UPI00026080F5|nr:hypothetical protein [Pseudomonas sp. M47T1]EIK93466.1 lipoprotein [Pseudomonas sp. M47T1]
MNLKAITLIPVLGLTALLSACAGTMPKPDPHDAWVGLQEEARDNMMAEKLDGHPIKDGRFFQVAPGKHSMQVAVYAASSVYVDDKTCHGTLTYARFKPDEHYELRETSTGANMQLNVGIDLVNAHGKTVAYTQQFDCAGG